MNRILFILLILLVVLSSCSSSIDYKQDNEVDNVRINPKEFKSYIKNKPYTVLYFWVSWCGFSKKGLLENYNKHYDLINNDTVQSMLIVMSDTSSINRFMKKNNLNLPYRCLHPKMLIPPFRNFQDSDNLRDFMNTFFNYDDPDLDGFPSSFIVDEHFDVVVVSKGYPSNLVMSYFHN